MRPGRRDGVALVAAVTIVAGAVLFVRRIHTAPDPARVAGIVQGELAPVAVALVLLPLLAAWWAKGRTGRAPSLFFGRRHRAYLRAATRDMDLRGLVAPPEVPVAMDTVFVDVSVAPRPVREVPGGVLRPAPAAGERRSIREFLGRRRPAVLALVGGPGTGKSTLLRHLARSPRGRRRVPVLVELRRHASDIVADPRTPLWRVWQLGVGDLAAQEPAGWMRRRLERGRCVVLLDGLDEVPSPADDELVRDWIADQIALYPGNDFVVSSRPHDYAAAPLRSATTLEVRGLTDEQVRAFVGAMYRALAPAGRASRTAADDLVARLHSRPALAEFATNPLLLTMIVLTHRSGGTLPDNRAALYADVCASVLGRRSGSARWGSTLTTAEKQRALAALAYAMMRAGVTEQPLRDIGPPARDLLADAGANGLLIEVRRDRYAFAHRSFQEYLAARHVADHDLECELAAEVNDDWWHETLLLYASLAEPGPVVRACLERGSARALGLAVECAATTSGLDAELERQLTARVNEALRHGADPEWRDPLVRALLHDAISPFLPLGDGRRLGSRPVSQLVYQAFLTGEGHPPPDVRWETPRPGAPATGLWPGDAHAFVAWLNSLEGSAGARYAVATAADMRTVRDGPGGAALGDHQFWATESAADHEVRSWTTEGDPDSSWLDETDFAPRTRHATDLLAELLVVHARGICRALALVDGGRPENQNLVGRTATDWYVEALENTLTAYVAVAEPSTGIETVREALRSYRQSGKPAGSTLVEKALIALPSTSTAFSGLRGCVEPRFDVDTGTLARAIQSYRREQAAIPPVERRFDKRADDAAESLRVREACHESVSAVLGDALTPLLAAVAAAPRAGLVGKEFVLQRFRATAPTERKYFSDIDLSALPGISLPRARTPVQRLLTDLLARTAEPIVARRRPPVADDVSLAGWCALVIAAESGPDHPAITLARGIGHLERRASGAQPGEVLFLTL